MNSKIIEIFKFHLQSDNGRDTSIENLVTPRKKSQTNYSPYYQRNYVWEDDKASYFIESMLLGYQIPPIIIFSRKNRNKNILEIIDGRQRYETVINYMENRFPLNKNGLYVYTDLNKKRFFDLEDNMRDRLSDFKITQVKYSLPKEIDVKHENYIIQEIFRRYNSGITKMKIIDNERAEYIDDSLSKAFQSYIKANIARYNEKYSKLFFAKTKQSILKNSYRDGIEELSKIFRKLYVIHLIPIKKYLSRPMRLKNIFNSIDREFTKSELDSKMESFDTKVQIIYDTLTPLFQEEYLFSINKELTTVFYWALSILEQNDIPPKLIKKYKMLIIGEIKRDNNYEMFEIKNINYRGKPLKFQLFIEIIYKILEQENIDLKSNLYKLYINSDIEPIENSKSGDVIEEPIRTDKSEIDIDTIISNIKKKKYLIRPPYQRNEVINNSRSSAIIESILLDIKLPPIFIYKRLDGVSEVIDGQQRLLSIIGFLGEQYINENGEFEESKKSNFKLVNLKILKELNDKNFSNLSEEQQNNIWDNSLTIIEILERDNPSFNPTNLFLRLNTKPYPIDENSFEMWNSYLDKELTDLIKVNPENKRSYFKDIVNWAYLKKNDKRMKNEELYTILAHIDYKVCYKKLNILDILDIHTKSGSTIIRLKRHHKQYTTRFLEHSVNLNSDKRERFIHSLKNIRSLFEKIKMLLLVLDDDEKSLYMTFNTLIMNPRTTNTHRGGSTRRKKVFYLLYVLLSKVPKAMILEYRDKGMLSELASIFRTVHDNSGVDNSDRIRMQIEIFIANYTADRRTIRLNDREREALKEKQKYICPLCQNRIFKHDKIHIDHIHPLSKGGKDEIGNMQITHEHCNLRKGNRRIDGV